MHFQPRAERRAATQLIPTFRLYCFGIRAWAIGLDLSYHNRIGHFVVHDSRIFRISKKCVSILSSLVKKLDMTQ